MAIDHLSGVCPVPVLLISGNKQCNYIMRGLIEISVWICVMCFHTHTHDAKFTGREVYIIDFHFDVWKISH